MWVGLCLDGGKTGGEVGKKGRRVMEERKPGHRGGEARDSVEETVCMVLHPCMP